MLSYVFFCWLQLWWTPTFFLAKICFAVRCWRQLRILSLMWMNMSIIISPDQSPYTGQQEGGSDDDKLVTMNDVSCEGIRPDKPSAYSVYCRHLNWRTSIGVYSRYSLSTVLTVMNWNAGALTCGARFIQVVPHHCQWWRHMASVVCLLRSYSEAYEPLPVARTRVQ